MENVYQIWCDHVIYKCNYCKEIDGDMEIYAEGVGVYIRVNKKALKWINKEAFEIGGHQFIIIK